MSQATAELAELLSAISGGDRKAFRELYDRSSAKLFGVVLRIVRDRAVASEVLQECYLRIWQNSRSYDPSAGQAMTWMIAIARYAAIDLIRRRGDAPAGSGEQPVERLQEPSIDPERDVIARDDLDRCLRELDPTQREGVVLAYCNGLSREELARHFGRPVATVKTWLRRSLIALRICLEGA